MDELYAMTFFKDGTSRVNAEEPEPYYGHVYRERVNVQAIEESITGLIQENADLYRTFKRPRVTYWGNKWREKTDKED